MTAMDDVSTAKSRTGYTILYCGCPLTWSSKLQTQIALSTTEAEYMALSTALREVIPLIQLVKEMGEHGFGTYATVPMIYCKAFEDNSGALEMSRTHKLRPRTKHINVIYHHFRSYVRNGLIKIFPIDTEDQVADIFTKPLPKDLFLKHRRKLLGW